MVFTVVLAIAGLSALALAGVIAITLNDDANAVPAALWGLLGSLIGGLTALLASTRSDPAQLPAAEPSAADAPAVAATPRKRAAAKS